ncbi:hypothetical protein DRQ09_04795, partial [candidate division KSB1 bacterium]
GQKKRIVIILLFFLFPLCHNNLLFGQNKHQEIKTRNLAGIEKRTYLCGTPVFNREYIKKAIINTEKLNPDFFKKTIKSIKKISKTEYNVGDTLQFYAINHKEQKFYTLTAELRAKGQKTQIWVEKAELENGRVTDEIVNTIMERLEHSTPTGSKNPNKGIVELEIEYFGEPPNKDGDGLVDFLLLDIKDNYPQESIYYAGYFTSNDQTTSEGSNQRDLLYIDTYPSLSNVHNLLSNVAHEFQHLIHYNYDKNEQSFLNEGLSQYAQILTGYNFENPSPFFEDTNRNLTTFASYPDPKVIADYVKVQLWTLYLEEQLGDNFIKNLVQDPENGLTSIKNLLTTVTPSISWDELFSNWVIANILNNNSINPAWGYALPQAKTFKAWVHENHNEYPVSIDSKKIDGVAGEYSRLSSGLALQMSFNTRFLKIKAIEIAQNEIRVIDVNPNEEFKENKFGTTYREIILCFVNPINLQTEYSYTACAEQSYFVKELKYDDGVNDVIFFTADQRPVNLLWFGYNTQGSGWAVKFHPPNKNSTLLKMKIYGGVFNTDDFEIRVYDDSGENNSPGKILAPPKKITINESKYFQWINVDFQDQAGFLTGFENDFYVSILHDSDDTGAVFLAVDKLNEGHSNSWALFGPTFDKPGWRSFSELLIRTDQEEEVYLDSFNLMIRVEMTYADEDEPVFTTGFLQHPIFTENIDVYVVGKKELSLKNLKGKIVYGDSTKTLNFKPSGTSGKVFVDDNVVINQNGKVDITIEGTNKYGFIKKDTTISMNVQGIQSTSEGKISTLDGIAVLNIPAYSLKKDAHLIAFTGYPFKIKRAKPETPDNSISVSKPATFSPAGILAGNAEISFRYDIEQTKNLKKEKLYIAILDNNKWIPIKSYIDYDSKTINATINRLGTYQLRYDKSRSFSIPLEYVLYQNYPNPFNPETTIRYSIKKGCFVTLRIYNLLGQEIRTLVNGYKTKGTYKEIWNGKDNNGRNVSSGIYLYRLKAGNFSRTLKLVLTK